MKGIPHHASAKVTAGHEGWLDWTYKGVDHSFPGNGGLECRDFLSLPQRYWESGAASIVAILALILSYPRLRLPPKSSPCGPGSKTVGAKSTVAQAATVYEPVGKRILLLLMCLTFGIELGFKFATRQMIWIGNPCHLATMMQVSVYIFKFVFIIVRYSIVPIQLILQNFGQFAAAKFGIIRIVSAKFMFVINFLQFFQFLKEKVYFRAIYK